MLKVIKLKPLFLPFIYWSCVRNNWKYSTLHAKRYLKIFYCGQRIFTAAISKAKIRRIQNFCQTLAMGLSQLCPIFAQVQTLSGACPLNYNSLSTLSIVYPHPSFVQSLSTELQIVFVKDLQAHVCPRFVRIQSLSKLHPLWDIFHHYIKLDKIWTNVGFSCPVPVQLFQLGRGIDSHWTES